MEITRKSTLTGVVRTRDLPVTKEQLDAWLAGQFAQDAFPHLSADDREFIISGITPEEWAEAFPPDDEPGDFSPESDDGPF